MLFIPAVTIRKGKIALKREKKDFQAGFCLVCETLPALQQDLSFLHPHEKAYYDTLAVDKRKLSYLLGRKAAKQAIVAASGHTDLHGMLIDWGVFQFPVVKYAMLPNMQVSISHCNEIGVALAFPEEHPMGIDIERIDAIKTDVMKSKICASEFTLMTDCQLSFSAGCTMVWTIREALSKVCRTGLTIDFSLLKIRSMEKSNGVYTSHFYHFAQYKAISFHAGNYSCSIVLPRNTTPFSENFFSSFADIISHQRI